MDGGESCKIEVITICILYVGNIKVKHNNIQTKTLITHVYMIQACGDVCCMVCE